MGESSYIADQNLFFLGVYSGPYQTSSMALFSESSIDVTYFCKKLHLRCLGSILGDFRALNMYLVFRSKVFLYLKPVRISILSKLGKGKQEKEDVSQSAITCSKLTIQTLKQGVKYVQS